MTRSAGQGDYTGAAIANAPERCFDSASGFAQHDKPDAETVGRELFRGKCCSFLVIGPDFTSGPAPRNEQSNCSFLVIRCSFPFITARIPLIPAHPAGGVVVALRSTAALMGTAYAEEGRWGKGRMARITLTRRASASTRSASSGQALSQGARWQAGAPRGMPLPGCESQHFLRGRRGGTHKDVSASSSQSNGTPLSRLPFSRWPLNHSMKSSTTCFSAGM